MKLVDIVTSALAVFETSTSEALNNGRVDELELIMLQTFHLGALMICPILTIKWKSGRDLNCKKSILEEINDLKKAIRRVMPHDVHALPFVLSCVLLQC